MADSQKFVYRYNGYRIDSDHELSPDEVRRAFKTQGVDVPGGPSESESTFAKGRRSAATSGMSEQEYNDSQDSTLSNLNRALAPVAHPQGVTDMAPLLLSNFIGSSLETGMDAVRSGMKAHPELTGVTGKLKAALQGVAERWRGPQPLSAEERAIAGTVGNDIPIPPPSATVQPPAPDAWDRMLAEARQARKPSGPTPVLRKGTSAPTVSDALKSALEDVRGGESAKGTTPPGATATSAGKEGEFYSSGRPSVTAQQYDEISAAAKRGAGASGREASMPGSPQSAAPAAAAKAPTGGGQSGMGHGAPTDTGDLTGLAQDIAKLRRKYGAERIGKTINPKAPEAGVGDVLRAEAAGSESGLPAGSAMPDIAQQALLRDLTSGSTKDPSRTLRALGQLLKEYRRNKGAANSDVGRELASLLKKHGFDIPDVQ